MGLDDNRIGVHRIAVRIIPLPQVALVEMPAFCSCYPWCVTLAHYLKYVSGYWISRGVLYLGERSSRAVAENF